ncbi:MAG: SPL family radical SAM protein [Bacillota bacterium]|uniref:radical SAM protein n=1 Tax=Desulforudis sp. DRI-14 TaxID=3459793 RepID=UPI003476F392
MKIEVNSRVKQEIKSHKESGLPIVPRTSFIKQFGGPGADSRIICFRFWELVVAAGCPYRCSYCFLQATPSYVFGHYPLQGAIFENWRQMIEEVVEWLKHPLPRMLVIGELQDGLAFDSAYRKVANKSLTEMLIPLFAEQSRHRLLFLTKSTVIENALRLPPTNQVVFSWSVNAEEAARRWEIGAPLPSRRIAAARRMMEAGWPVRFRLDPMIPFDGWREGYLDVINRLNELRPEMVTIGALRASNTLKAHARRNGRDASIFELLKEKDASNFKWRLPQDVQIELFRFAYEHIDGTRIATALCKEDASIWESVGMSFKGCHCLVGNSDEIAGRRHRQM